MMLFRQAGKTGGECFGVFHPVTQGGIVGSTPAEQSVINDKEFRTNISSLFCDLQETVLIKIKVCTLPAVQKNRTGTVTPETAGQAVAVKSMVFL